jgi:hypothetical protein
MILFSRESLKSAFEDLPRNPKEYPDAALDLELHVRMSLEERDYEIRRMPCKQI